jgi:hypothetical protein
LCGSCNKSISDANIGHIVDNKTGVTTKVCLAADRYNCGQVGKVCGQGQLCSYGQCVCATRGYLWFSYNDVAAFDSEYEQSLTYRYRDFPAPGCNKDSEIFQKQYLAEARSTGYLAAFLKCVDLHDGLDVITPQDFENVERRHLYCDSSVGRCNSTFCDGLYEKLSFMKSHGMCEAFSKYGEWYADCAMNYRISKDNVTGDATCRDMAIKEVATSFMYTTSWLDVSLFMGCPEAKRILNGTTYYHPMDVNKGMVQYMRNELAKTYLGSAANIVASMLSVVVLVLACVFVA